MIRGHGIDIQSISAVQGAFERREKFIFKVLTARELERFYQLKGRRQIEFLAGRWAAKEAFMKALGLGLGQMSFLDISILPDAYGAPQVYQEKFVGQVWLSISHSDDWAAASVVLEERENGSK